ncbi:MAG: MFS transporter [Candidatus Zixiibacteriota bacterium]
MAKQDSYIRSFLDNGLLAVNLFRMTNHSLKQGQPAGGYLTKNFWLGVTNGVLFNFASAFISASTVLPLFLSRLTSSQILIGLASSLETLGWFLPQIAVAAATLHRKYQKPIYVSTALVRGPAFLLFAVLVFVLGKVNPSFLVVSFFFLFSLYSFGGGLGGVAFTDIVGKAVPPDRRGSFFGTRMFLGGGLAAISGVLIQRILKGYDFPTNFGILFLIASALIFLALTSFVLVQEPPTIGRLQKRSIKENLLLGLKIARGDRNYRMLLLTRIAIGSYIMGLPFYILYAKRYLFIPTSLAGILLSVQMVGYLSSNLLWAYLSNRSQNRLILVISAFCASLCPLLILLNMVVRLPMWTYGSIFFFLGATMSGTDMGYVNYLLEIAPEEKRPIYIGFLNTVVGLTVFLSALGGLIIQVSSFASLYVLLLMIGFLSILLSFSLKDLRKTISSRSLTADRS